MVNIRQWRTADAQTFAVYAVPYPQFVVVAPVLFWLLIDDDETSQIVGGIVDGGQIIPASQSKRGVLVGYVMANMADDQVADSYKGAQKTGEALYAKLFPDQYPKMPDMDIDHLREMVPNNPLPVRDARGEGRKSHGGENTAAEEG